MNKLVTLWVVTLAAVAFGGFATTATQRKSQTYALAAARVFEDGATTVLRFVWKHI